MGSLSFRDATLFSDGDERETKNVTKTCKESKRETEGME